MEPLEVNNFAGGITDFILQGSPNRAEKLDNFVITQDSKLVVRDAYLKPLTFSANPFGANEIDGFASIESGEKLLAMANSVGKVKDKNPGNAWQDVTGDVPNGGQISYGEYTSTVYLTSDEEYIPRKIYQDENGNYVARRVGLPQMLGPNPMTDATLLADCIALANDIRATFVDHLEDYKYATYTDQTSTYYGKANTEIHANRDKKTLSYFQTETFVGGDPESAQTDLPAQAAATNSATLFTLIKALKLAMNHHMGDASVGTTQQNPLAVTADPSKLVPLYHNNTRNRGTSNYLGNEFYAGPMIFVDDTYDITNVVDAAKELDALYRIYYIHKYGLHIHSFENDPAYFALYPLTEPKIGTVYSQTNALGVKTVDPLIPPTVTPNYTHFYNFINNVKFIYRKHIFQPVEVLDGTNWPVHTQKSNNYGDTFFSTAFNVDIADCTSVLEAEILLYHLRLQFFNHNQDASPWPQSLVGALFGNSKYKYWTGSADFTGSSATIADVKDLSAAAQRLAVGSWIYAGILTNFAVAPSVPYGQSSGYTVDYIARVSSSSSGGAVLDRTIGGSTTGDVKLMASWSKYHGYAVADATNTGTSQTNVASASSVLATTPDTVVESVTGMMALAEELFFALESHTRDGAIHISGQNGVDVMNNTSNGTMKVSNTTYLQNVPDTPFFIPEYGTLSYAFFYSDAYVVDQFQQTDRLVVGNPVYVGPIDVMRKYAIQEKIDSKNEEIYPNAYNKLLTPESITDIPTLALYDTDIKVNIYRQSLNGSTYFLVDEIANGTSSYLDYSLDTVSSQGKNPLITRQEIYTTGGVVGFDQVEGAKFLHIVNNKAYYAGIYEDGKLIKNRLLQSINGAPDAVPASFFDDFEDEIVGLSSARSNLIVFCKNSIYRESGEFGETGQGYLKHDKISDVIGGLNQKSIVQTEIGVFFAGTDGFYYTDGYQIIKLSLEIDKTYKTFTKTDNQKRSIVGSYDTLNRRIWFSVKLTNGDNYNTAFYVLHLNDGVKPSAAYTKCYGANIDHTTHIFFNGANWVGVADGYIKYSSPDQKSDENTTDAYTKAVQFNYLSCALDAGTIYKRKYTTKLHVMGDNNGNAQIQPYIVRDKNADNNGMKSMPEINYQDNLEWGQPSCLWGNDETYWNNTGMMDEWRRFPRTTLRSDVFQVGFRNADIGVYNSENSFFPEFTFASVETISSIATIYSETPDHDDIVWPSDLQGMFISFDFDDYETKYEILSQSGNELTFDGTFPADLAEMKFVISGNKKNQRASINSYVVHFAQIGDSVKAYARGDSGKNQ